jgi:hypothetical protein
MRKSGIFPTSSFCTTCRPQCGTIWGGGRMLYLSQVFLALTVTFWSFHFPREGESGRMGRTSDTNPFSAPHVFEAWHIIIALSVSDR